jgi:hypothetical protein
VSLALGDLSGSLYGLPVLPTPPIPDTPSTFNDSSSCGTDRRKVTLTWTIMLHATGYNIYRNGKLLTTTGALSSSFTDDNTSPSKDYRYEIEAINEYAVSGRISTQVQTCH